MKVHEIMEAIAISHVSVVSISKVSLSTRSILHKESSVCIQLMTTSFDNFEVFDIVESQSGRVVASLITISEIRTHHNTLYIK